MALISYSLHGVVSVTEEVQHYDIFSTTKLLIKTDDNEVEIILFHKDPDLPHTKLPFKDIPPPLQSEST